MKKNPKQIAAIIALIFIIILIITFFISSFISDSSNTFSICLVLIIAVPILSWIFVFCYGRLKGEHSMAELFPKEWQSKAPTLEKNPDNQDFTEEELTKAMEEAKDSNSK